jgi:transcription initiation factor TFIIIB Brf1 subunit/transcription initiation factor TFIIB
MINQELINEIWEESKENSDIETINEKIDKCNNCDNDELIINKNEIICNNCGFILNNELNISCYDFEEQTDYKKSKNSFNKITKMQKWLEWTNDEKNIYKLKLYTRNLCKDLNIYENLIDQVCDLVIELMNNIKLNDGPKRCSVKNGIIIVCINYISKKNNCNCNSINLAKQMNLDIKYLTKADKILMEIINCNNTLNIDLDILHKQENPIDYINEIIFKYNLSDCLGEKCKNIIDKTTILINICQDNDILTDHTPLVIGVGCFFYILNESNINVDMNLFTEMCNTTNITILKINNKLKEYKNKIDKLF